MTTLILVFIIPTTVHTQSNNLVFSERSKLVMGMYNRLLLAGCIPVEEVEEVFYEGIEHYENPELNAGELELLHSESHSFIVIPPPNSRVGVVVKWQGLLDTTYFSTEPIIPKIRLGGAGEDKPKVKAVVAKAQRGLYATVEGYDICATLPIDGFEFTLVKTTGSQTTYNVGQYFSLRSQKLLQAAKVGDLLVFRNIKYRNYPNLPAQYARDLVITVE